VRPSTATTGLPDRYLVVVLDANAQANANYISASRAAAAELAAALPPDVRIGLMVLNNDVTVALAPTLDHNAFIRAVSGVQFAGATDPLEALSTVRTMFATTAPAGDRHILLLTDGRNVVAGPRNAIVGGNVATSGMGLDVVGFGTGSIAQSALRSVASAAGGRATNATDQTSVATAWVASAQSFPAALAVTAYVPTMLSGQAGVLQIKLGPVGETNAPVLFGAPPAGSQTAVTPRWSWVPGWLMYLVGLAVFVALGGAVLAVVWPKSAAHNRIKQIAHFGPGRAAITAKPEPPPTGSAATVIARTALAASASVIRTSNMEERIALKLDRAGLRMRPHEWLLVRALVAGGAAFLLGLVAAVPGVLLGLVVGWLLTTLYLSLLVDRRARQFAEQLPDALQLVIGSLRSGFSLSQAIESLVRESPEPVAAEFGRALAEHRLGADLSDALDRMAQRTTSEDLGWAIMAVRIQREVGGNLAEVLQTSVDTMRERARLRRHVRALTAEGRLSAWVLIGVPLVLGLFMFVYRRSYLSPLITDPRGLIMLVGGSVLFIVGIIWMTRLVRVED
jgi:tight adherence protein B